jgi:transposase
MREIAKKLKLLCNAAYYSLHRKVQTGSNQYRKRSGRPRCTTKQEDKYIRVFSLRNRRLTSPQLAASLNSTHKTPVLMSTVKRRLRDARKEKLEKAGAETQTVGSLEQTRQTGTDRQKKQVYIPRG